MRLPRLGVFVTRTLPNLLRAELLRRRPGAPSSVRLRPTSAWLNVTDACNMQCVMCNQWETRHAGELTTREWCDVIDQPAALGIKETSMSGGEPLLFRELPILVREGRARGMTMRITTSGWLLDAAKLDALLDAGPTGLTISIDATGDAYERIRGRTWAPVLRTPRPWVRCDKRWCGRKRSIRVDTPAATPTSISSRPTSKSRSSRRFPAPSRSFAS
jgi:hypothetical protein